MICSFSPSLSLPLPLPPSLSSQTDIQIEVPDGCYGRVAPRSGLAAKHGIDVGAGVIDKGAFAYIRSTLSRLVSLGTMFLREMRRSMFGDLRYGLHVFYSGDFCAAARMLLALTFPFCRSRQITAAT